MPRTLTAANTVITLSENAGIFNGPQQLQGFDVDDIFDTNTVTTAEVKVGVDAKKSQGWTPYLVEQGYSIQADSDSIDFFEQIMIFEKSQQETVQLSGVISMPGQGKTYTMVNGTLREIPPVPTAKKVVQPRKFMITWESANPAPQ